MQTKRYLVKGRVQGVGFRVYVRKKAQILNLRGWVKNLSDGRVEVFANGDEESLAKLFSLLQRGPVSSNVLEVKEFHETLKTELVDDFEIRHGQ